MTPRLVVAGTHSGVGKTTIATGLMAAFRSRGRSVASAKVGPDFIDPGYHSIATGRPPRNLDAWICGADAITPLAARAAAGADLMIVEGVMGMFDGAVDGTPSSTAAVAKLIDAPVVLVVDGSAMSASVAALVRGYRDHDPDVLLAGVILNRVASESHRSLLTEALDTISVPVLGCLGPDEAFTWRDRHLGLVPIEEQRAEVVRSVEQLGQAIASSCDLEAIGRVASVAGSLDPTPPRVARKMADVRVAVATGPAFTFTYHDNVEALIAAGAEIATFDPLHDESLPADIDGLVIGGGFPEVSAARLADNQRLLREVRMAVHGGLVTWAECGGLMWLTRALDARPLAAVVAADSTMTTRLTLGYREATVTQSNPLAAAGDLLRGHEFHYSEVEPSGDALLLTSRFGQRSEGFASPRLLATYLHQHLGGDPTQAERFVATCAAGSVSDQSLSR